MTAWSIVVLATVLSITFTICWGLWLNAVYPGGEISKDEIPVPTDETAIYPSEEVTGTWPTEEEKAAISE